MSFVAVIASILNVVLLLFILVMLVRLVLEWIPIFNREWRPRGAGLVVAEGVYTVTDPPIRALRRVIPPLRVGGIAIDFAFAIVMFGCFILLSITRTLAQVG